MDRAAIATGAPVVAALRTNARLVLEENSRCGSNESKANDQNGPIEMTSEFKNLERMGLSVHDRPAPHVKYRDVIRRLGQWRYGFALRLGAGCKLKRFGVDAAVADQIIGDMAAECEKHWTWGPL